MHTRIFTGDSRSYREYNNYSLCETTKGARKKRDAFSNFLAPPHPVIRGAILD